MILTSLGLILLVWGDLNENIWTDLIFTACFVLVSILFSLSMYLVLDHNRKQYLVFLKFLRWLKVDCVCCCGDIVVEQISDTLSIMNESENKEDYDGDDKIPTTNTVTSLNHCSTQSTSTPGTMDDDINKKKMQIEISVATFV